MKFIKIKIFRLKKLPLSIKEKIDKLSSGYYYIFQDIEATDKLKAYLNTFKKTKYVAIGIKRQDKTRKKYSFYYKGMCFINISETECKDRTWTPF